MKRSWVILFIIVFLLAACGGEDRSSTTAVEPAEPATEEPAEPATADPVVAEEPVETEESAEVVEPSEPVVDMVGIWVGTVAGEKGYVMYTEDGRFLLALSQDNLASAPRVSGEYWIENNQIHLRDLENAGHWTECDAETIGVYDISVDDSGKVKFQTVEDGCDEGGFTRNYVFANMIQEWIAEPVEVPVTDAMDETGDYAELAATLQGIADTWVNENGVPGFIMMVDAPDMDFTWKGAAGMADPDAGEVLLADDQFIISSISKMFTSAAVMKLVEQGKLSLDDPMSQYLPEERVSNLLIMDEQSYGEEITVRQLLNHSSGLGDFSNGEDSDGNGLPDFKDLVLSEPDTIWDEMQVLDWAETNALPAAKPGEMFNYSDTNYQLLGMIIENVAGLQLHEVYRQWFFEPLGMEHTYFEFREEVVPGIDSRPVSNAYYKDTLWNDLDSRSYEWGSGGLVSTVEDLDRFLWAWTNGDLFDDPAGKEEMMVWEEAPGCGAYYGLGLWRIVYEECEVPGIGESIGHSGLFNSYAYYWPEQNVTLIGTLNTSEPDLAAFGVMIETMFALQEFSGG